MRFLYDLVFLIFGLLYLPYLLFKKKLHRGFFTRLGFLPDDLKLDRPVWLHAVSVGEAMAARPLIDALRKKYPFKKFVLSTVTATGNKIARGLIKQDDFVFYLPLDFGFSVKKVITRIKPSLFIIVETEIWPNLISCLHKKGIPIILVNGRISHRSFCGYRTIRPLIKPLLNKINLFCVQTDLDFRRLVSLGVKPQKIKITGSMKFDFIDCAGLKIDCTDYRLKLGISSQEKLIVCGSTHPGEEEIILVTYKRLIGQWPGLKLLICPRHPERTNEIEKTVMKNGFIPLRISQLNAKTDKRTNEKRVFIVDTIGQLLYFYAIADIVFVGGSLVKKGGHNILEPSFFKKPILFGLYMHNFRDIAKIFLENKAALSVSGAQELYAKIVFLLNNIDYAGQLGERAQKIIFHHQGATERNLRWIASIFSGT